MTGWIHRNRVLLKRCRIVGLLLGATIVLVARQIHPTATRAEGQSVEAAKAVGDHGPEVPEGKRERVGHLLKIRLPVVGKTYADVRRFVRRAISKARADGSHPVLIFQFVVNTDESQYGRGSDFGASADLARFLTSKEVGVAETVAYVPHSIQGHAVLPVLACDQIVMAEEAEIGSAGIDEQTIDRSLRSTYREIASRRKNFPVDVALAMLDPALEVLQVKTEFGTEYVSPEGLKKLREQDKAIQGEPEVLIAAGQPGQFTGAEARQHRFINYLASRPREVARALELPPQAVEEDFELKGDPIPMCVWIRGPIEPKKLSQVRTMIDREIRDRNVNFVCVRIESAGGDPTASIELANYLALDLDPGEVRTVAYIDSEARSDAALLALACDRVVMRQGAILGGSGAYAFSDQEIRDTVDTIRSREGAWGRRSWSLIAAIVDPNLDVYQYTRQGDVEYLCEDEAKQIEKEFPGGGKWVRGKMVTRPGAPLKVTAEEAEQYRLADDVVGDFADFRQRYDLDALDLAEPGWADFFIQALASPAAAGLLLMIGFFAAYAELHSPGIGIGGFLAAVCFMLFFWSRFLGGTSGWLEAVLFVAGVSFLMLEVFVLPGFGIFGLGGAMLVIASLVLAGQTFIFPRNAYQWERTTFSLTILVAAAAGGIATIVVAKRWLPDAPVLNRMFLKPPVGEEAESIRRREALVHFDDLLGTRGTTTTQLTPSGKARFGNRLVDVIAEGELIERGADIVVVEVHGNRVLVQAADETPAA